jgi:hypothetical protein
MLTNHGNARPVSSGRHAEGSQPKYRVITETIPQRETTASQTATRSGRTIRRPRRQTIPDQQCFFHRAVRVP